MADQTPPPTALETQALAALVDMLKSATAPDAIQAQTILLRRLALQGDVTGSRVPAPRNITEIGGYLNLLGTLHQPETESQALTGILGVAGPNPPLGWFATKPPLSLVALPNDRPDGPFQPVIPLEFTIRSDFVEAFQGMLTAVHDQGCVLPLLTQVPALPLASTGLTAPSEVLPFLGRALTIVPAAALRGHTTYPIVLARPQGTAGSFGVMARVLSPGQVPVAPADWDVLECDDTSCTPVAVNDAAYVPLESALAKTGFYPASPEQPTSLSSIAWAQFTNVTALVAGSTRLGDELALLYDTADINGSVFSSRLHWIWNGTTFAG